MIEESGASHDELAPTTGVARARILRFAGGPRSLGLNVAGRLVVSQELALDEQR